MTVALHTSCRQITLQCPSGGSKWFAARKICTRICHCIPDFQMAAT